MLRVKSVLSPYSEKVIQLLVELHELDVRGEIDSAKADEIRDAMEPIWHTLTTSEKARITGLSEDLNELISPKLAKEPNPQSHDKLAEAYASRQRGDWDSALGLLRRWSAHMEREQALYLKGSTWMELGSDAVASVFFKEASELAPQNESLYALYLHTTFRANPDRAIRDAQEVLSNANRFSVSAVVIAAGIVLESMKADPLSEPDVLEQLIQVLVDSITELESRSDVPESVYLTGLSILALCYEITNDFESALNCLHKAIRVSPNDSSLFVQRGMLRYGRDKASVEDFERAVRLGTDLVWPYLYLAHHHLMSNEFSLCYDHCVAGLQRSESSATSALLWEWIAISQCELERPVDEIRKAFESAVAMDANNTRIKDNMRAFEALVAAQTRRTVSWQKVTEATINKLAHTEITPFDLHPATAA